MIWSVIITTHNRCPDLCHTLTQLQRLAPAPDEIIVCADGCDDGTVGAVRSSFPGVHLLENASRRGSIPSRDRMIRLARGDLVLSLDDDSHPIEIDFLARAAERFRAQPKLAVLWFPQRSEEFPDSLHQTEFGPDQHTGGYSSSGAVLRRSAYLGQSGYVTRFGHAYEEPDYALQCLAAGWDVQRHTALHVRHYFSVRNRNEIRTHHLHSRNEAWSVLLRCPTPWWPFMLVRRAAGQFRYATRRGASWVVREPRWWWDVLAGAPAIWRQRSPVAWNDYCRWLTLMRHSEPL